MPWKVCVSRDIIKTIAKIISLSNKVIAMITKRQSIAW